MATPLSFNRGNHAHTIKGLTGNQIKSEKAKAGVFVDNKSSLIENKVAGLAKTEATALLTTLKGKIQDRKGFLKLMHTEHPSKTLSFETKSGISSFFTRKVTGNERRSETEGALKGAFKALKLNNEQLSELSKMLASHSETAHLEVQDVVPIIGKALEFAKANEIKPTTSPVPQYAPVAVGEPPKALKPQGECEARLGSNLKAFRKISVGGIEIGGSARPLGDKLKNGATFENVISDIQEAGFTHILSLDQSKQYGHDQLKSKLAEHAPQLTHLNPEGLNIRDMFEEGSGAYADSKEMSVEAFKEFKTQVENLSKDGKKVLVHCGAGSGRTGTMMASLVLADLIKREAPMGQTPKRNQYVEVMDTEGRKDIITTPLVARAIQILRDADTSFSKDVATPSVESSDEVKLLEEYEKALLKNPVP